MTKRLGICPNCGYIAEKGELCPKCHIRLKAVKPSEKSKTPSYFHKKRSWIERLKGFLCRK